MNSLVRIATAGSVDDGKSTLIGRLLYDTNNVPQDQVEAIRKPKGKLDLAALSDGLSAEREQGITIDVAYRYFTRGQRSYILADTPGHERYTRNMFTGVSTADFAIILIDATKGFSPQTYRHITIAHLLDVPNIIAAINKMDLVKFNQKRYSAIVEKLSQISQQLGASITAIPIVAKTGDNIVHRSLQTLWYAGPTLLEILENSQPYYSDSAFVLPIQGVIRPGGGRSRLYTGQIASGVITQGQSVTVLPEKTLTSVTRIDSLSGSQDISAVAGQSVNISLANDLDISRGSVLVSATFEQIAIISACSAMICWFDLTPAVPGKRYIIKLATQDSTMIVRTIRSVFDPVNLTDTHSADLLQINDIGSVDCEFARPLIISKYTDHHILGSFIIIDKDTYHTVGAGIITDIGVQTVDSYTSEWVSTTPEEQKQAPIIVAQGIDVQEISAILGAQGILHYIVDDFVVQREYPNSDYTVREKEEFITRVSIILADAGMIPILRTSVASLLSTVERANMRVIYWDGTTTVAVIDGY